MPKTPQEFPKKPPVSLQALEQKLAAFANESLAKTSIKELEYNEICKRVMMQARIEFAPLAALSSGSERQAFVLPKAPVPLPRPSVATSTPGANARIGQSDVPYVLGSSKDGSLVPGTYIAPIGLELAQTDTWDINNPPINAGSVITRGVQGPFIRRWEDVSYYDLLLNVPSNAGNCTVLFTSNTFFVRTATYDSSGILVAISAETPITGLNSTTTGSSTTAYLGAY